jgi:hypothetical protein
VEDRFKLPWILHTKRAIKAVGVREHGAEPSHINLVHRGGISLNRLPQIVQFVSTDRQFRPFETRTVRNAKNTIREQIQ